mgnify:CR=1 FL=1
MPKKKASKKSAKKSEAPKRVLRQIDSKTQMLSSDERFPEVKETMEEKLEKGMVRIDAHNIISVK